MAQQENDPRKARPAPRGRKLNDDGVGYILIAPFILATMLFVVAPILVNIWFSFTNYNLRAARFIGLKNYAFMLQDEVVWKSLWNTLVYTFFTLTLTMVFGLFLAMGLQKRIPGLQIFRTLFYIPNVTSMVSVSMIWLWLFDPTNGFFNHLLAIAGLSSVNWLYDSRTAMGALVTVGIWKSLGYYMIIYLAGLNAIPKYLYEAATIDGASSWKQFMKITVPLLTPVSFFLFITGFMNNFKVFEQVQIMTAGGPLNSTTTIVHQIYQRAFNDLRLGYAAALSVLLLVIVLIVTLFNFKYGNQGADLEST